MIVKGYRGKIDLGTTKKLAQEEIYVFNSRCIIGREHLEYAYMKAEESFKCGRNIANNFHIEIMLILTGKRQINTAVKLAGIENADSFGAISPNEFELDYIRDDSVLNCTKEKMRYLGIFMDLEEKYCDLAFENSALLELER